VPFHLVWEDPDLGVHIEFREVESPSGSEIVAFVTGRPEDEGQSVVVALEADRELKFLQRSVTLELDKDQKCGGQVSFGHVADIVAKLGVSVVADAFLMERQTVQMGKQKEHEQANEKAVPSTLVPGHVGQTSSVWAFTPFAPASLSTNCTRSE